MFLLGDNMNLAQSIKIGTSGNEQTIQGPLVGINSVADLINRVLPFVLIIGSVILLLVLIWGGFDYMTSAGNPEKTKSAQAKFTTAIIGFLLIVFAFGITKLITYILGFQSFF